MKKFSRTAHRAMGVLILTSILSSCGRQRGDGNPVSSSNDRSHVQAPAHDSTLDVSLYDGFETGQIAGFWQPGDHGSGRFEPGAVSIVSERARSGSSCVKITVNEGDIEQTGSDGKLTERAELDSGKHPMLRRDVWCGFSFLVPDGFPIVDNRLVISQWKQSPGESGPLIAQRYRAGRHDLTIHVDGDPRSKKQRYSLPEIQQGRWTDIVYHIRFSNENDGFVEVWINGKREVNHRGITAHSTGEDLFYNKFGLYRDRWKSPMTIYFDEYTLGSNYEDVDPARLDRPR